MSETTDSEVRRLIEQLGSKNDAEREAAIAALTPMGAKIVPALIDTAKQERQRAGFRFLLPLLLFLFGFVVPISGVAWIVVFAFLLPFFYPLIASVLGMPDRRHQGIMQVLSQIEDKRAIGPLVELLYSRDKSLREAAETTLKRLLPPIRATNADLMTDIQMRKLFVRLDVAASPSTRDREADLLVTILQAAGQVAEHSTLNLVYTLVHSEAATRNELRVREAAKEALALMEVRLDWGSPDDIGRHINALPTFGTTEYGICVPIPTLLALKHLLPQLGPEDRHLLTAAQRRRLYNVLEQGVQRPIISVRQEITGRPFELIQEILGLAARWEDTLALPAIRRLAVRQAPTLDEQALRVGARALAPLLEAKLEKDKVGKTLLRASQAPVTPGAHLLRPATDSPETAPQQLLRASAESPD